MKSLRSLAVLMVIAAFAVIGCGSNASTEPKPVASPSAAPANPQNQVNQKAQQHANDMNKQIP